MPIKRRVSRGASGHVNGDYVPPDSTVTAMPTVSYLIPGVEPDGSNAHRYQPGIRRGSPLPDVVVSTFGRTSGSFCAGRLPMQSVSSKEDAIVYRTAAATLFNH